ncbi:hypothetical protein ACFQ4C_30040 [Larkinella insperata]|uniref:Helix-turn-helix domain-containing protein n=1 Tax=Larkinella insperata TaxID=332158 RepID=A0ABW3QJW2_9BACT
MHTIHQNGQHKVRHDIHRGKLNIAQAAAKFEVSRKTVNHWLEKVEKEAEKPYQPEIIDPAAPFIPVEKTAPESSKRRPSPDQVTISKLKGQLYTLKEELKAARIKTLYYATLIQLAEQELGIDIEKKPPRPGPLPSNPMYDIRKPVDLYSTTRRVAWFPSTKLLPVLAAPGQAANQRFNSDPSGQASSEESPSNWR